MSAHILDSLSIQLEEQLEAQAAVRRQRERKLATAIDELERRFRDCAELIVAGQYDYERAFEMCRKQSERCTVLRNRLWPPPNTTESHN